MTDLEELLRTLRPTCQWRTIVGQPPEEVMPRLPECDAEASWIVRWREHCSGNRPLFRDGRSHVICEEHRGHLMRMGTPGMPLRCMGCGQPLEGPQHVVGNVFALHQDPANDPKGA